MESEVEKALKAAGEQLYRTFERYRGLPTWGDGMSEHPREEDFLVVRNPVRALEQHVFGYYAWKAISLHDGGKPALKYFFPRVLYEAAFPPEWNAPHILEDRPIDLVFYINKMVQLHWQTWDANEQEAIRNFFFAWFEASLDHVMWASAGLCVAPLEEREAEVVLQSAAFLELDTGPMLAAWAADESAAAISQIVEMLRVHGKVIIKKASLRRWDQLWGKAGVPPERIGKVVRFLTSARTFSRLERAFFAATDPYIQEQLGAAVDQLRRTYEIWHGTLAAGGTLPVWAEEVAAEMYNRI